MGMQTKEFQQMILSVAEQLTAQKELLCKLDSFVGDGDHGLTVERGFKAVQAALTDRVLETPAQVLQEAANALVDSMGGAIGPIIGGFFEGSVKKLGDVREMGTAEMELMLTAGLRRIQLIGGAAEGDRTLVDALSPATAAFSQCAKEGGSLSQCMEKAAQAGEAGAESTRHMVAKQGRAKFLGEASLGHVDAGATTMSILLRTMSDEIRRL
jgi:dihydroxyacetone kinase phosphoprotein-dependent L subunit